MFERYDRPVRCSAGHLFTTIWVPMVSVKALRLGTGRWQHCPVGHHWALVSAVDPASATTEELVEAGRHHDVRLP